MTSIAIGDGHGDDDDLHNKESSSHDQHEDVEDDYLVEVNVGGTIFTTFKSTLTTKSCYFYARFAFDEKLRRKENSKQRNTNTKTIFLDHNPREFETLLDYMRYGCIQSSKITLNLVLLADFLGMEELLLAMKCTIVQNQYPKEVVMSMGGDESNKPLSECCCELFEETYGCGTSLTSIIQQNKVLLKSHLHQDPSKKLLEAESINKGFAHMVVSEMGVFTPPYPNTSRNNDLNDEHSFDGNHGNNNDNHNDELLQDQEDEAEEDRNNFSNTVNFLYGLRQAAVATASGIRNNASHDANNSTTGRIGSIVRQTEEDDALLRQYNSIFRHYEAIKDCHIHLATFLYVPKSNEMPSSQSPAMTTGGGTVQQEQEGTRRSITNQPQQEAEVQRQQRGRSDEIEGAAAASVPSSSSTTQISTSRLFGVLDCPSFLDGLNRLHQLGFTTVEPSYNHIDDNKARYLQPIHSHFWFSRSRRRNTQHRQSHQQKQTASNSCTDDNNIAKDGEEEYKYSTPIIFDDAPGGNNEKEHQLHTDGERRQFAALINTGLDNTNNQCNVFVLANVDSKDVSSGSRDFLQFVDPYGHIGDTLPTNLTKISFPNDHELLWWLDENGYHQEEMKLSKIYEKVYRRGFKILKGWRDERLKQISVVVRSRKL